MVCGRIVGAIPRGCQVWVQGQAQGQLLRN